MYSELDSTRYLLFHQFKGRFSVELNEKPEPVIHTTYQSQSLDVHRQPLTTCFLIAPETCFNFTIF